MKYQLSILLALLLCPVLQAQNVVISDTVFKHYLLDSTEINSNGDKEIQVTEAEAFSGEIDVEGMGIRDLTGIEAFKNLTSLNCEHNMIDSLNVSLNPRLQALSCRNNDMDKLIVGSLPELTLLSCYNNALVELDLSAVPLLSYLSCGHNQITQLDLSQNPELNAVRLQDNKLTSLDMRNGNNGNIQWFISSDNPSLSCISVDDVSYSSMNWTDKDEWTNFSSDCSQSFELQFEVRDGSLPVKNAFINFQGMLYLTDASGVASISFVSMGEYAYSVGAEGYVSSRGTLLVSENQRETISLVAGTSDIVYIPDDQFRNALIRDSSININGDIDIQVKEARSYKGELRVASLQIEDMTGIEHFVSISSLRCQNNQIHELDVSSNVGLVSLYCYYNFPMQALRLDSLPSLEYLDCYSCQIGVLDLSQLPSLLRIKAFGNMLETLDFTQNSLLTHLEAQDNSLQSVDLRNGNNEALTERMDLTENPDLKCISVDNIAWAESIWTSLDEGVIFSLSCTGLPSGAVTLKNAVYRVYPNPASGSIFFEGSHLPEKITLQTIQGRQILEEYPDGNSMDISRLRPGMYLVGFYYTGQVEYHKIMKY